ncbi:MAG: hypothetical protein IKJ04_02145, partial [Clostridia bacterium]|nr:hypothetical protein [Clostridia bacterium]
MGKLQICRMSLVYVCGRRISPHGIGLSARQAPLFSVMYGRFENDRFTVEHTAEVDKGPDQYAGQIFTDHLGRNLLISWIPGWKYDKWFD